MKNTPDSGTNNRYGQRIGTRWDISMRKTAGLRTQGMGMTTTGRCVNVSQTGIMFQSSAPYQVGDELDVKIFLTDRVSVRGHVRILRMRPALTRDPSYGAEFVRFHDDNDRKVYDDYVQKLNHRE